MNTYPPTSANRKQQGEDDSQRFIGSGCVIALFIPMLILSSCAVKKEAANEAVHAPVQHHQSITPPLNLSIRDRLGLPVVPSPAVQQEAIPLYSLRMKQMEIADALSMFARAYKLNMIVDPDIKGMVNVDFHDLPFNQAMEAILDSLDYHWQENNGLIHVQSTQTRSFTVDYIRLIRSSAGNSQASASSGSSDSGGSENQSGSAMISQKDSVQFWGELEKQQARDPGIEKRENSC